MRVTTVLAILFAFVFAFTAAWEREGMCEPQADENKMCSLPKDHQLFQLNDDLKKSEGPNETFYSFIGVSPGASHEEITKAYRKRASRIHPDKAKQSFIANYGKPKKGQKGPKVHKKPSQREINVFYKEANDRFARLGVIAKILQGPQRERYDFFLKTGFPAWRGTGWYYQRYRPGLGTVMIGLFIVMGGVAHYGALYLSWKRQRQFMERYIRNAKRMAWGDETGIQGILGLDGNTGTATGAATSFGTPSVGEDNGVAGSNRRQRRMQERADKRVARDPKAAKTTKDNRFPVEAESTPGPRGTKKRVIAENGKILVVDSVGNVYLEQTNEEGEVHEYLLDLDEIQKPTIYDTAMLRLPIWVYGKIMARFSSSSSSTTEEEIQTDSTEDTVINQSVTVHPNEKRQRKKPATVRR